MARKDKILISKTNFMETLIKEKELPIKELEKLGLFNNGALNLGQNDIDALLAGRRTDMQSLKNLQLDGFGILQLDAKLSLGRNAEGKVALNLHPIYKQEIPHPLLSEEEARNLREKKIHSVQKEYEQPNKILGKLIIEYDEETREFVAYRPDQVEAPEKVNGETLSEKQKKDFKNGELVQLEDGTRFQHSAADSKGVRSDRARLIFSVLVDGGLSYLVFRGLKNLKDNLEAQKQDYTKGYNQALADMMVGKPKREIDMTVGKQIDNPTSLHEGKRYGSTMSR